MIERNLVIDSNTGNKNSVKIFNEDLVIRNAKTKGYRKVTFYNIQKKIIPFW